MVLDLGAREEHAALEAHAVTDNDIGANGHVGADTAVLADLGGRVNQDVAAVDVRRSWGGQLLGALLCKRREVETRPGEEILGLSYVHPEAFQII